MNAVIEQTARAATDVVDELVAAHRPGYSLAQRFYTDPDIYALELERIVFRNWILVGHESEFSTPGDFRVLNVAGESAIVVCGNDGVINGFANVCRHRGSLVCLEAAGNTDKFSCPYHGWMYDVDGKLIAARDMANDFDFAAHSLKPVSVASIHGLVFAAFTDDPPALDGCIRDLAEPMALFGFDNMQVAARKNYDIPANWKLSIENYTECYHCAPAHPEYAVRHTLMLDDRKLERVQQPMLDKMEACGLKHIEIDFVDTEARPGEISYGYSRTAMFNKYKTGSRDGEPLAPLLGKLSGYDGGASDFTMGPFSYLLAYSDHVVAYVFTPVEQNRSNCEITWLVRGDTEEGKDYDVDELTWLWDVTTHADKTIIVNNAKGVHSRYYEPGPFSGMEELENRFVDWILQELQRP